MKGKFKNLTCKEKALIGAGIGNIVLASLLVLIVLGVPIAQVNSVQQTAPATSQGFSTLLLVKVYDKDGNLIAERVKEGDLWLKNFGEFLKAFFDCVMCGTVKDESGNSYYTFYWLYGSYDAKICVGTGTTPPTPDDYKLENQVAEASGSTTQLSVSGNAMNVTFSASFTFDSAQNISESGVKVYAYVHQIGGSNAYYKWIYIIRDTFDPVSVPAGGTITITYIIRLNQ